MSIYLSYGTYLLYFRFGNKHDWGTEKGAVRTRLEHYGSSGKKTFQRKTLSAF